MCSKNVQVVSELIREKVKENYIFSINDLSNADINDMCFMLFLDKEPSEILSCFRNHDNFSDIVEFLIYALKEDVTINELEAFANPKTKEEFYVNRCKKMFNGLVVETMTDKLIEIISDEVFEHEQQLVERYKYISEERLDKFHRPYSSSVGIKYRPDFY